MNDNTVAVTSLMGLLLDSSQLLIHRHSISTPPSTQELFSIIDSGIILRTVRFKDLTFPGEEVSLQTLPMVEG